MIQAVFFTGPSGELTGFRLTGHSGLAEEGSDILCAAVSSAAYMTANTVSDVIRAEARITDDEGYMNVAVALRDAKRCRDLFEGFKLHLQGLEEQYPENIEVSYLEV